MRFLHTTGSLFDPETLQPKIPGAYQAAFDVIKAISWKVRNRIDDTLPRFTYPNFQTTGKRPMIITRRMKVSGAPTRT